MTAQTRRAAVGATIVIALVAAAFVGLTVQRQHEGTELVSQSDGGASGALGGTGAHQYRSAYFGSICTRDRGSATIRSIAPVDPRGGLEVTDFSVVAPASATLGAAEGRLRDEPSYQGTRTVTTTCGPDGYSDLFVEVYKPRRVSAWADEFRIVYTSAGHERTARLRFGFALCEKELDHCDIPRPE